MWGNVYMFRNTFEFYRSTEWRKLLSVLKNERQNEEGQIICEYCNKPIVKAYDMIGHHKTELTEENVNDFDVSLNPENIAFVHHRCHNFIHNKFNDSYRKVYLVYGAPFSGIKEFVKDSKHDGDLVVDIDLIWNCISDCGLYVKPKRLNAVVFKIRDQLLDAVRYRLGKWKTAYICGSYPLTADRERLCRELGAEEVLIESTPEECKNRLHALELENEAELEKFIDEWFEKYNRGA
jgi:hypothetical protein